MRVHNPERFAAVKPTPRRRVRLTPKTRRNDLYVDGDAAPIMNPAEVALAQLDVLLDEQEAAATPPGPPAAACPTRRRIGNPTNEAPASLPAAAAAALRRRREHQPAAAPPAEPAEPEEQPAQLRCSKRLRVAPAPVAEFARGAEVEALWEGKWYPGVVAEVVVEQDGVSYEIAWADGQYQNRIRALSRSGEKLVRRRTSAAAALALERRRQQTGEGRGGTGVPLL